jgi:hypothetical protein
MLRWVLFLVLSVTAGLALGGIDPDEFECEEAAAQLKRCCDQDFPSLSCGSGCSDVDIDLQSAVWIRNASCEDLVREGYCNRDYAQ